MYAPEAKPQARCKCQQDSTVLEVDEPDKWYRSADSTSPIRASPGPSRIEQSQGGDVDSFICIYADLLIPGRGDPLRNQAIGIALGAGKIAFVGSQTEIPAFLKHAARTRVRVLMPGLWDCHTHFAGVLNVEHKEFVLNHPATLGSAITRGFHETLMAGFTSVRDVGSFALEAAVMVEKGVILGPSVFGAGAAIGISGGHTDWTAAPAEFTYAHLGSGHTQPWAGAAAMAIADGEDECRRAVRQQIRRGARCIKVAATGGVLSDNDDPQYRQFSDRELAALVDEARLQKRTVAAHAHGKDGIVAAIRAGVNTIEHGSYIDEEVADLMVEAGVALVSTRHVVEAGLRNLDSLSPPTARKMVAIADVHARAYRAAVRRGVKIALGTDIGCSRPGTATTHGNNGNELAWAVKVGGLTPLQAIEAGTISSAEILGPQMPKKGLIRAGWDADMIALDENPLDNIDLFRRADNIKFVWKGGDLVKCPGFRKVWP